MTPAQLVMRQIERLCDARLRGELSSTRCVQLVRALIIEHREGMYVKPS